VAISLGKGANVVERAGVERAANRKDVDARRGRRENDWVALLKIARERRSRGRIIDPAGAEGGSRRQGETQTQRPAREHVSSIRKSGHQRCLSRFWESRAEGGKVYWVMNPIFPA
jgi:hypothetical protein